MKLLFLITLLSSTYALKAQNFEGSLTYQISCKNCSTKKDSLAVEKMFGTYQQYYYKDNNYLSELTEGFVMKQLYLAKSNLIYNKFTNGKKMKQDASMCTDSVVNFSVTNPKKIIAGLPCKQLIINYASGNSTTYYFDTSLTIDFQKFSKHCLGNWSDYTAIAKALPLGYTVTIGKYNIEFICTNIQRKKLPNNIFTL